MRVILFVRIGNIYKLFLVVLETFISIVLELN